MASEQKKSGLSVSTLLISSLAAVAAAVIVPTFWEKGTLVATAMTPVVVAVVSEALRKPVQAVSAAAPRVTTRRTTAAAPPTERFDPLPPRERETAPAPREDDPFGLRAARRPPRHHWKLALATGVVAFAVAAVALTGSELVFGGPATKDGGRTTLFSGSGDDPDEATPTATPTATEEATPEPTVTPTATVSPAPTPTVSATPAPDEAAPTPTVTPAP